MRDSARSILIPGDRIRIRITLELKSDETPTGVRFEVDTELRMIESEFRF